MFTGNKVDAVGFWNESKELFLSLFADGTLIPLVRRASMSFIRRIRDLLNRMVRFLWALEGRTTPNQNLVLLDLQVILSHEVERAARRSAAKAQTVSKLLPDTLERLQPLPSSRDAALNDVGGAVASAAAAAAERARSNSASRVSRFFARLFRRGGGSSGNNSASASASALTISGSGSGGATEGTGAAAGTPSDSVRSAGGGGGGGGSNKEKEKEKESREKRSRLVLGTQRLKSSGKTNAFDSFLDRSGSGFGVLLTGSHGNNAAASNSNNSGIDVRRFYNRMNAGLVVEKLFDFGWSQYVDYGQLIACAHSLTVSGAGTGTGAGTGATSSDGKPIRVKSLLNMSSTGGTGTAAQLSLQSPLQLQQQQLQQDVAALHLLFDLNARVAADYVVKYMRLPEHVLGLVLKRRQYMSDSLLAAEEEAAVDARAAAGTEEVVEEGLAEGDNEDDDDNDATLRRSKSTSASLSPLQQLRKGNAIAGAGAATAGSASVQQDFNVSSKSAISSSSSSCPNLFPSSWDLPLDPFADFAWMDESFADYSPHNRPLLSRLLADREYTQIAPPPQQQQQYQPPALYGHKHLLTRGGPGTLRAQGAGSGTGGFAQFSALYMPEFEEAHLNINALLRQQQQAELTSYRGDNRSASGSGSGSRDAHRRGSNGTAATVATDDSSSSGSLMSSSASALQLPMTGEQMRQLDERAETVLIQRCWRCYLQVQNAERACRAGKRSLGVLRNDVRNALSCMSLSMVRLRAFSRQYQHPALDFDSLTAALPNLPAAVGPQGLPCPLEQHSRSAEKELLRCRSAASNAAPESVRVLRAVVKETYGRKPVLVQYRLPFLLYVIHVS